MIISIETIIITPLFSQEVLSQTNAASGVDSSGGIIVYTHNMLKAMPLQHFENTEYEAIWLKIVHPDPVYDENIDDDSGGIRVRTAHYPVTIGKCFNGDANK